MLFLQCDQGFLAGSVKASFSVSVECFFHHFYRDMLFEMEHENKTELLGECPILVTKIISVMVKQTKKK